MMVNVRRILLALLLAGSWSFVAVTPGSGTSVISSGALVTVPSTGPDAGTGFATISATACPGATCYSVGFYQTASAGVQPLVVTSSAGVERSSRTGAVPASTPTSGANNDLGSIACPTTTWCIAVGTAGDASNTQPYVAYGVPAAMATTKFLPSTGASDVLGYGQIGVGCWAAAACVIAGNYEISGGAMFSFITDFTNGVFSHYLQLPKGPNWVTPVQSDFSAVSCFAVQTCMVAGGAKVTNGGFGGDTILDHEGTLTFVAAIATTRTQDPSLTCLSGEACVVSEDGDFYARLHLKTATTLAAWQFFGFTTPSNVVSSAAGSNDGFASLDCVTLTSCVTGGFFNTRVDDTSTNELLVSSFSTTATDPLTTLIDPDAVADASLQYPVVVGCSPTGSCTLTYDTQSGVYLAATATPPGPVSAVAASAVSATSAKLSWRAPAVTGSGLKGYVVARRLVTATTWNTLALRSTPSVLLTGLTANAHYDVRLEAESTDGSLSAPVTVLVATSKKLMGAGFRFRDSRNANVE